MREPVSAALAKGVACRCPACGRAPLFEGFLRVRTNCGSCGADLSGQDSGDGPAAFIILLVGAVVVAAALFAEIAYSPPVWLHMVLWLPLSVLLVLGLMRPFKAILIALQYRNRREDFGGQP